ncbi:MAG: UbiA prenyltransferase family protein [Promethearchaeota archaeon]
MRKKIKDTLYLLRVRQYYKNILVFVGAFFSENLLITSYYFRLIVAFILLCCVSSINYIINDWIDIEKDKLHPEKLKKRPLANGSLSVGYAIFIMVILSSITVISLIYIIQDLNFLLMLILILITGQLYNHICKNYAFLDIIMLSLNYLWRALAGCFIIGVFISPWLFLAIIEIALFLVIAKRKGDFILLGEEDAKSHKKSYNQYNLKLLEQFHTMIATSLFVTYSIYLILKFNLFSAEKIVLHEYAVILTIPIMLYIIMRYMYLTSEKPEIARSPEKAFFDKALLIAGAIFMGILFYSFYFDKIVEILHL